MSSDPEWDGMPSALWRKRISRHVPEHAELRRRTATVAAAVVAVAVLVTAGGAVQLLVDDRRAEARRPSTAALAPASRPGGRETAFARKVLALVNEKRAKAGCGHVRVNHRLGTAARHHSQDMAAKNYFSHTSPDGRSPGDRISAAGYRWRTYGENIARGQQTPARVMAGWMGSAGHRANILNCDFKELGVGVHDVPGGPWWTQAFGASR